MGKPSCFACDGTGTQPAADGSIRPCSRCDVDGFHQWSKDRAPATQELFLHTNMKGADHG